MAFFQSEKPGFSSHNETGTSRFRLKGFQIVSTAALQQPLPPPLGRFIATTCAASFHRTIINPPVRPPRLAGGLVRVFQINYKKPPAKPPGWPGEKPRPFTARIINPPQSDHPGRLRGGRIAGGSHPPPYLEMTLKRIFISATGFPCMRPRMAKVALQDPYMSNTRRFVQSQPHPSQTPSPILVGFGRRILCA